MSDEIKQMMVRVPVDLHRRIKNMADDLGISMSQFVADTMEDRLGTRQVPLRATREGYLLDIVPGAWFSTVLLYYCGVPDINGETYICPDCQKEPDTRGSCGKPIYGELK